MHANLLQYARVAQSKPYHAALVPVPSAWRNRLGPHAHADFHELLLVTRGTGHHWVFGRDLPLRAGDLVLVRPGDQHEFSGDGPGGMSFINIAFRSERWRAFTDSAGVTAAAAWDDAAAPPRVPEAGETVSRRFHEALGSFTRDPRALDVVRLWSEVLPLLEEGGGGVPDARPAWLVSACGSMASGENLRAGLPRLRELAGVSHGHLARSMAEHYGATPVQFVTEHRLAHAALLLATTTDSVGQIAQRCGFASQSYFGRRFLQRHGSAPRDSRERVRRAVVP